MPRGASALDSVGAHLLTQMAAAQPLAEADVKALEAKPGEKVELSAKQVAAAATAFQKALDDNARRRHSWFLLRRQRR